MRGGKAHGVQESSWWVRTDPIRILLGERDPKGPKGVPQTHHKERGILNWRSWLPAGIHGNPCGSWRSLVPTQSMTVTGNLLDMGVSGVQWLLSTLNWESCRLGAQAHALLGGSRQQGNPCSRGELVLDYVGQFITTLQTIHTQDWPFGMN